jgi:two-component system, LytTR family, sensor kinase
MNEHPESRATHLDARVVLLTIAGIWLFYFATVTLRAWVVDFPAQGVLAWRRAIVTAVGICITIIVWRCMRPFDHRPLRFQVTLAALLAIPAALAAGVTNYYFFYYYDPGGLLEVEKHMPPARFKPSAAEEVVDFALTRYFFFVAWAALYLAIGFAHAVREAERRAAEFARAAQTAELRALRYQVNPHFLFNTLNSLSALVLTGKKEKAEAMILNLSNFYRTSLSGEPSEDVTLSEEVALQQLYLDIEAVRFPERLIVEIDIPENLANAPVPGLILQPLVENAVKHGVSRTAQPVTVRIAAAASADGLDLTVSNSGSGDLHPAVGHGIGLTNVRDRLAARFGDLGWLEAENMAGGGWRATLHLPMEPDHA